MSDYELVIHRRDSVDPTRVPMPGVPEHEAEADRQQLLYDIDQARLAEAPVIALQSAHGFPEPSLDVNPHDVTGIDLEEAADTPA